jgi:hypothetical protein
MVFALKELSIRGDFRTTVEYLIKLLEHFLKNSVDTGWLDRMIVDRVKTEKPDVKRRIKQSIESKKHVQKGLHLKRSKKIRTNVRFRRPVTLSLPRVPRYQRKSVPHRNRFVKKKIYIFLVKN